MESSRKQFVVLKENFTEYDSNNETHQGKELAVVNEDKLRKKRWKMICDEDQSIGEIDPERSPVQERKRKHLDENKETLVGPNNFFAVPKRRCLRVEATLNLTQQKFRFFNWGMQTGLDMAARKAGLHDRRTVAGEKEESTSLSKSGMEF